MARTALFTDGKRVNILIESEVHQQGVSRAKSLELRGGFSEYVARLIKADKARKGRAVLKHGRAA
jgi:hypothetical protein